METTSNQSFARNNGAQRPSNTTQGNSLIPNSNQGLPSLQTFNHLEEPNILSNILKEQKEKNSKGDPESARIATKEKLKEFQIPAKWEWLPCNYELKREEKSIETHWSLSPTIQLIGNDQKNPPIMDISINLERPFMHNDELGWNWHKSWNLPNLTISIKINDAISNDPILPPADLKAQLFAVKVLLNKSEQFKLYDLGLKGSTIQDLSEGQCTFSAIKFSSTSYNNDGVKFHLIVLIYIQDDTRSRACPRILHSRISPPIFVDSRKSARDSNVTRNKKVICKYFDPFPADTFEKTFIKRNTKLNESKEEIIENSLGGLSQYFTAPNIRNKVKHPVFLAAKFSNCVRLFYNANLLKIPFEKGEKKEEDMILIMQKILMESGTKEKNETTNSNKAFDNKYFILLIEEPNNLDSFLLNKKISDYLDPIINDVLHIIFNSNIVPPHFRELPNKNLVTAYANVYNKLIQMRDSFASQPSTPEHSEPRKRTKNDSPKAKGGRGKKEEINKKRGKQELDSDNEDDEESEMAESISNLGALQKKVKTESDRLTQGTSAMEEIVTPSPKPTVEPQLIKPQPVQPKPQQQIIIPQKAETLKVTQPQKPIQPKPSSQMKVENERFEIKNEIDNRNDSSQLSKMKSMLGANGLSDIDIAALMKGAQGRQGMMNEAYLQALRQQNTESLKANKMGMQLPGNPTQSMNGLPFGQNPLQGGNESSLDMMSNLPEQMRNQLMMSALYQNSGKNLPNKNANPMGSKGFSFGQQSQVPPQLQSQLGAQLLQNPQFQLQQQLAQLQAQDFGKDQQMMSNDFGGHPLLNQLLMQQQMGNLMMGGNGPSSNPNFANLLGSAGLNSNSLPGGFPGMVGNNQGNSQVEGLLRGLNMNGQNMNMASLMANIGKLGGLQK